MLTRYLRDIYNNLVYNSPNPFYAINFVDIAVATDNAVRVYCFNVLNERLSSH